MEFPSGSLNMVDEHIDISFSSDKTEAYIKFSGPSNGGKMLDADRIIREIQSNNIVYGLDKELLERITAGERQQGVNYRIAVGKKVVNGKDGFVEIYFNSGAKDLAPKVHEDGSVDYRDLNLIESTEAGKLLAKAVLRTEGVNGINVFGKEIAAQPGKVHKKLVKGKGTRLSDNGLELYADVSGQIVYSNGNISISEVLEIRGDVDNSTGNINFNGSVIISGNILSDFKVMALGNIDVGGAVEGAEVSCQGNLVASKGIIGMGKAVIEVRGNISARMIQDCTVYAGGSIVSDGIMHSNVKCDGGIKLTGKKGVLVGGEVAAKEDVELKILGSPLGTATSLRVGLDASVYENYKLKMQEYQDLKTQFETVQKTLSVIGKAGDLNNMPEYKKKSYINSLYEAKRIQEALKSVQTMVLALKSELDLYKRGGRIKVSQTVHPGVNVQLGNAVLTVKDNLDHAMFVNDDGRVTVNYSF